LTESGGLVLGDAEEHHLRVGQLPLPLEGADLTDEHALAADLDLLCVPLADMPRLREERHAQ
jgi:hypothetical protein